MKIKQSHHRIALLLVLAFFIILGIVTDKESIPADKKVDSQKLIPFPIDLNSASIEELTSIPGIGPVKAQRIVEYRETHGGFSSVKDLINVSGIGEKTLDKISKYITVKGVEQLSKNTVTKLNINTATSEELERLPYIGEVKAKAILEYREKHGPFSSPEELLNVPGIGEKILERIRGKITF
ncbi:ComEA family DNA-binding protein [Thermotoga sp. KOL6]|uniref:ComEA family DNA-binding protein n=1 Tax=Thermotoga sp. KOL6 TaxID=126741 RepID=UPI000C75BD85|nr:ComEA family DNA-binding protein [Thermotoga sp. KOL6]PLV59803.1 competence protein ComEA [Thermotoga sp. KOL6]